MLVTNFRIGTNGRLGNQLFQAATAIGVSERAFMSVGFPESWRANHEIFEARLDMLTEESITAPRVNLEEGQVGYKNIPEFILNNLGISAILNDENNRTINLDGYFQSEKYFNHCRPLILALLQPKAHIQEYIGKNYAFLQDDEWTSLHVRRGDYVGLSETHPLNPHPLQPVEYYHNAIEHLGSKNILVFSDDINWCKENFKNLNCKFVEEREHLEEEFHQTHPDFVKTSDENLASDYTEMNIMAACHNHIIANSSFSWWGAWLNDKEEKQVCAPLNWFSPQYAASHTEKPLSYIYDIIPESWKII